MCNIACKNARHDRFQFVQYNGVCSQNDYSVWSTAELNIRSITFLLYINDICNVSTIFHMILFADDT
jgi:hypothetical protein